MATYTHNLPDGVQTAANHRLAELKDLFRSLETTPPADTEGDFSALAMFLIDSTLDGDEDSLDAALDGLQRLHSLRLFDEFEAESAVIEIGRIVGLIDTARWGLERVIPQRLIEQLDPSGQAFRFLLAIAATPGLSNKQLLESVGAADETAVSRLGRQLVDSGLARKARRGRTNSWDITLRGQAALETVSSETQMSATDALRRAYEALANKDYERFSESLHDDVVWHVPGDSHLAGPHKGPENIVKFYENLVKLSDKTFCLKVHDVAATDVHGWSLVEETATRGSERLHMQSVHVGHWSQGVLTDVWIAPQEPQLWDAFWE